MSKHYFNLRASSGHWQVQIDPIHQVGTCSHVSQLANVKLTFKDKVLVAFEGLEDLPFDAQVCIKICGFLMGEFEILSDRSDGSPMLSAREINTLPYPYPSLAH